MRTNGASVRERGHVGNSTCRGGRFIMIIGCFTVHAGCSGANFLGCGVLRDKFGGCRG